eukprot:scaffold192126_cov69-Cyclotella_meneghiniana.AAC.1
MKDIKLELNSRTSALNQGVTSLGPHSKCFEELQKANHSYFIMRRGLDDYNSPIQFSHFVEAQILSPGKAMQPP